MPSRRTPIRTNRVNARATAQRGDANRTFVDYYRCPAEFASLGAQDGLGTRDGYFRFGDVVAFGRFVGAGPAEFATDRLADVFDAVTISAGRPWLPFNFSEVVTNLREERYRQNGSAVLQRTTNSKAAQRLYYLLRPLMRVGVRKHLQ